jgi:hypothetical protein
MIYRVTYALLSTEYRGLNKYVLPVPADPVMKTFLPDFSMFSAVFCFMGGIIA